MPINFHLTPVHLKLASTEAERRQSYNESKGLKGRNNAPQKGDAALKMHYLGCIGEVAVAFYLGMDDHLFQSETPVRNSRDLPCNLEVKTRSKHGYDLLIQLNDDPSKLFVLVTYDSINDSNTANIVGWAYGKNVMRKELIREFVRGRPCYAVPQKELNDIETLAAELESPSQPDRMLGKDEAWMTWDGDEAVLNFSELLLGELGWQPGDMLKWNVDPKTKHCYLRRSNDSNP